VLGRQPLRALPTGGARGVGERDGRHEIARPTVLPPISSASAEGKSDSVASWGRDTGRAGARRRRTARS
jgi:hypothetical protein